MSVERYRFDAEIGVCVLPLLVTEVTLVFDATILEVLPDVLKETLVAVAAPIVPL